MTKEEISKLSPGTILLYKPGSDHGLGIKVKILKNITNFGTLDNIVKVRFIERNTWGMLDCSYLSIPTTEEPVQNKIHSPRLRLRWLI